MAFKESYSKGESSITDKKADITNEAEILSFKDALNAIQLHARRAAFLVRKAAIDKLMQRDYTFLSVQNQFREKFPYLNMIFQGTVRPHHREDNRLARNNPLLADTVNQTQNCNELKQILGENITYQAATLECDLQEIEKTIAAIASNNNLGLLELGFYDLLSPTNQKPHLRLIETN